MPFQNAISGRAMMTLTKTSHNAADVSLSLMLTCRDLC